MIYQYHACIHGQHPVISKQLAGVLLQLPEAVVVEGAAGQCQLVSLGLQG